MLFRFVIRAFGTLVAFLVMMFGITMGYGVWAESRAEDHARGFCKQVAPGSAFSAVTEAAQNVGESSLRRIGDSEVTVGFTGTLPLSRHLCHVTADGELVASAEYFYID